MAKKEEKGYLHRNPYGNPPPKGAGSINFAGQVSRTKQEFALECDINRIMAKYKKTGELPPGVGIGRYGDFSEVGDFQEAQERVKRAEIQFAALPASVRDRFKNSPAELLAFVHDEKNYDEAVDLGLLGDEARDRAVAARKAVSAATAPPPKGEK